MPSKAPETISPALLSTVTGGFNIGSITGIIDKFTKGKASEWMGKISQFIPGLGGGGGQGGGQGGGTAGGAG